MIFIIYIILAIAVITFSIKVADYVDLIDKKTNISGAFIGGVVLAAVTSLPELFTSISAVVILENPELVMGNILGSNIFNLFTLSVVVIIFLKLFLKDKIGRNHFKTSIFVFFSNLILFIPVYFSKDFSLFNISVISIVICIFYFLALKFMANDTVDSNEEEDTCKLTVKQICIRFILVSILLVIASILITYVTEIISDKLNLAASLSGALFLGIATSLPEVTSVVALAKKAKFNLAVGNIIGSNMFNLFIISIADLLYVGKSLYLTQFIQTKILLGFGFISTIFVSILLIFKNIDIKNKFVYVILNLVIIIVYLAYLILSL
mgnify:CR=1 FL=1